MYFCPNGCAQDAPAFYREVLAAIREDVSPSRGDALARSMPVVRDRGPVRCAECDARAEWRDARQEELFAVEPAMFS